MTTAIYSGNKKVKERIQIAVLFPGITLSSLCYRLGNKIRLVIEQRKNKQKKYIYGTPAE